jgi:metallophosphoesterase (TIGR03767 family)
MNTQPEPAMSASEAPGLTTMGRTVVVGPPDPSQGDYSRLAYGPPEPHLIRHLDSSDLSQVAPPVSFALTSFAQLTDLHITDDQSPLRVEFLDRYADPGEPHRRSYPFDSGYHAHECLTMYAVDAICRALRNVGRGPRTGLPLAFTMITGDGIDNCQSNELRWYIDILDGQTLTPDSGSPTLDHSVTSDALGLPVEYWHPASRDFELSNHNGPGLDNFFRAGFPAITQLPFAARKPFTATGLGMPWFACYGNHDALVQGNATISGVIHGYPAGEALGLDLPGIAVGDFKRTQLAQPLPDVKPDSWASGDMVDIIDDLLNLHFAGLIVPTDPRRQLVSRAEFIAAHFDTHGTPVGHGFELGDDASYVVPNRPADLVRHIVLDTTDPDGWDTGFFGPGQLKSLESVLLAGSSRFLSDDDQPVLVEQEGVADVLFVVHSHHAIRSIRENASVLERLLLRFPNVILLVNGHSHTNVITPHWRTWVTGPHGGFWEVGTSSVIDFPAQGRLFDLTSGSGTVSIFTTMIDIDAPLDFRTGDITEPAVLASLARELAANDLQERGNGVVTKPGTPQDRNVRLLLPAPFALPDPPLFGSPIATVAVAGGTAVTATVDDQDQVRIGDFGGSDPLLLDGTLRAICLTTEPDGALHLFGVNAAGTPWHRRQSVPGAWAPWLPIQGQFTAVAAARNGLGVVEFFALAGISGGGPDTARGTLWHTRQVAVSTDDLEPWQLLGDGGFTDIAATTDHSGRVVIVGVSAATGTVLTLAQTSPGTWAGSAWQALGSPAIAVTAACGLDGVVEIVLTDDDGRLQSCRQTAAGATSWTGWRDLDADWARFTIRKLAMTNPAGSLLLYGANADGQVFQRKPEFADPTRWGPWAPLPMTVRATLPISEAPSVTWPGDQQTQLGVSISLQLTAIGGASPIAWTVEGLPPGLSCNAAGLITGIPVASGAATHLVTASATDANLAASTVSFTWTTQSQVPDVIGMSEAQAVALVRAAGFKIGPHTLDNHCLDFAGNVIAQTHPGGALLPEGFEIRLTVSSGLDNRQKPCEIQ